MSTKQIAAPAAKPTNGKQANEAPAATSQAPAKPATTESKVPVVPFKKEGSDLPPVEDRVLKVQQLSDLVARREKLRESLRKLKSINTATENRDLRITIEDSDNEWETFNTDAIRSCVLAMEETIKAKLQEVENKITF